MADDATVPVEKHKFTRGIHLGMTVLWHEQGNPRDKPRPAIVTDISADGDVLGFLVLGTHGESPKTFFDYRDGVKHISDPRLTTNERVELGAWDYSPMYLKKPA